MQHQPQTQTQAHQPSPPSSCLFSPSSLFAEPPAGPSLFLAEPQQPAPQGLAPPTLQHPAWQHLPSSPSASSSSGSSFSPACALSTVTTAAHLLEARLHISPQPQLHPQPQALHRFTFLPHSQGSWGATANPVRDSDMQELGDPASGRQKLGSCVMVR